MKNKNMILGTVLLGSILIFSVYGLGKSLASNQYKKQEISHKKFGDDNWEQKEIRQRVQQGNIMSLESIMTLYPEEKYGKLLDLEIEREHGKMIYELEFLRSDGRIIELEIDAKNGQLLEQEFED